MKPTRSQSTLSDTRTYSQLFRLLVILSILFTVACNNVTSDESLAKANAAMDQQNYRAAEVILKTAIQKEGDNYVLRLTLADAYIAQSKYESAEKELKRADDFGAPVKEVTSRRYLIYSETGAHDKLRQASEIALASKGASSEDIFQKTKSLIMEGANADAANFWSEHKTSVNPDAFYARLTQLLVRYVSQEKADTALAELKALTPNDEQLYDYTDVMRYVYTVEDSPAEAITTLITQVELRPQHVENRVALVSLLIYENRFEEAQHFFSPFEPSWPKVPVLAKLKSVISFNMGNFDEAYDSGKKALSQGSADIQLLGIMGASAFKNEEYAETVVYLERLSALTALPPQMVQLLTGAYLALNEPLKAKASLQELHDSSELFSQLKDFANYQLYRKGYYEKLIVPEEDEDSPQKPWQLLMYGEITADKIAEQQWTLDMLDAYGAWLWNTQGERAHADLKAKLKKLSAHTASAHLELQAAFLQQRYATVNQILKALPADIIQSDTARLFQARVALRQEAPSKALELLTPSMQSKTNATVIWQTAFTAAVGTRKEEEVASLLLASAEHQPDDTVLFNFATRKLSDLNKTDHVLQLYSPYPEQITEGVDYLPYVLALTRAQELENALVFAQFWLEQSPYNEAAVAALATVLEMSGELLQAEDVLSRYLVHFASRPLQYQRDYIAYLQKGIRFTLAKPKYTEDLLQSNYYLNYLLAAFYNQRSEYDKALPHAHKAVELRYNLHSALLLGETLEANNELPAAINVIDAFAQSHSDNVTAKLILANKLESVSPDKAMISYEQVLAIDNYNLIALNNLAALLIKQDRLNEARDYVNSLMQHHATYPPGLDTAATWYEKSGDTEAAKKLLYEASRLDPSNAFIRAHLAKLTTESQTLP